MDMRCGGHLLGEVVGKYLKGQPDKLMPGQPEQWHSPLLVPCTAQAVLPFLTGGGKRTEIGVKH